MNAHAERVLEFDNIRTMLVDRCLSEEGSAFVRAQAVLVDAMAVREAQELVAEYRSFLEEGEEPAALRFPAVRGAVKRLQVEGVVLEGYELAGISAFADSAYRLRTAIVRQLAELPRLRELLGELPNLSSLTARINAVIDGAGEVKENEVPSLRAIRKRSVALQQEISRTAAGFISDSRYARVFNSDRPTVRDGRTVLAVATSHKNAIPGVIHEVSGSGQTVFLEPLQLVEKNNALAEAQQEYRRELLRLLRELSRACRAEREALLQYLDTIAVLDAVRAKTRWSIDFDGVQSVTDASELRLRRARHPMLGTAAVPIDIGLPEGVRTLIITGPNTGGKTVALKTVGLFVLAHQFGLQIPADEGSALPLFDAVYADIGDEQSIEQSLSTFSGHMTRIAEIAARAGERSLVLLDELGAGTDPSEGAAIGAALLEYFAAHSARVLLTTHHGALKRYGFARDDAENASVEFDHDRLAPTYRLLTGVPGASHALEVAANCGLPRGVIERAGELLKSGRSGADELVVELTERERELRVREGELIQVRSELEERQRRLADREDKLTRRELALKEESAGEHRRLVEESRRRVENLVRTLREGELTREKTRAARAALDELTRHAEENESRLASERAELERGGRGVGPKLREDPEDNDTQEHRAQPAGGEQRMLQSGMTVRVRSSGHTGLLGPKNSDGSWSVTVGAVRFAVREQDLELVVQQERRSATADSAVSYLRSEERSEGPVFELDLRGMRLEQAVGELERQIDRCLLSGTQRFGVIHGKGEGVLQQGTRAYLSEHAAVSEIAYAAPEEGGHGKTVVTLRA